MDVPKAMELASDTVKTILGWVVNGLLPKKEYGGEKKMSCEDKKFMDLAASSTV